MGWLLTGATHLHTGNSNQLRASNASPSKSDISRRPTTTAMETGAAADVAKAKIIQEVIQESKHELREVEQQLQALRAAYPEVIASIRTRQVAQEMLLVKEAYIHELKSSGEPLLVSLHQCCMK